MRTKETITKEIKKLQLELREVNYKIELGYVQKNAKIVTPIITPIIVDIKKIFNKTLNEMRDSSCNIGSLKKVIIRVENIDIEYGFIALISAIANKNDIVNIKEDIVDNRKYSPTIWSILNKYSTTTKIDNLERTVKEISINKAPKMLNIDNKLFTLDEAKQYINSL
jgi:hypothetical protein